MSNTKCEIPDINYSISEINDMMLNDCNEYMTECEKKYKSQIEDISRDIVSRNACKIIMLAGPSASGKTTTANILADNLRKYGLNTTVLSIDDFYLPGDLAPLDENGKRDYESVHAIDIPLVRKTLVKLFADGECSIPKYLFGPSSRIDDFKTVTLGKNDLIIIEGLHALNPLFTDGLNLEGIVKIFISPGGSLEKNGNVIFNERSIRLIRRLVRDYKFREASPQLTLSMWNSVVEAESIYIDPFISVSDYYISTLHPYEVCMTGKQAYTLLNMIDDDSEYYQIAADLLNKLKCFNLMECTDVPYDSLLREFLGNGKYNS